MGIINKNKTKQIRMLYKNTTQTERIQIFVTGLQTNFKPKAKTTEVKNQDSNLLSICDENNEYPTELVSPFAQSTEASTDSSFSQEFVMYVELNPIMSDGLPFVKL